MELDELRTKVLGVNQANTQRGALANHFLDGLAVSLAGLESLGVRLEVSLASDLATEQFPKMLFHKEISHPITVESSEEEATMVAQGWHWHPSGEDPPPAEPALPVHQEPIPAQATFALHMPGIGDEMERQQAESERLRQVEVEQNAARQDSTEHQAQVQAETQPEVQSPAEFSEQHQAENHD